MISLYKFGKILLFSVVICFLAIMLFSASESYDVIIKNTKIVDGTGKPAFDGDIGIRGERIVAVGKIRGEADIVIDGSGLITSPGFIDPHTHADHTLPMLPLAENFIMQGVTTVLGGNCGKGFAPSETHTFGEWLLQLEKKDISINIAMLAAHDPIRLLVMGNDWRREATSAEIQEMKRHVDEAMRSGAFGLSTGVDHNWPGVFASLEEQVELAKVAQKYGGFYCPHTRGIRNWWFTDDPEEVSNWFYFGPPEDVWVGRFRGYMEALEVARRANIPLHIAHFCVAYRLPQPHPGYLDAAAARASLEEIIDKARKEGLDVTFDVIPLSTTVYSVTSVLDSFLKRRIPRFDWLRKFKKDEFIERLKTKEFRARLRRLYDSGSLEFHPVHPKVDPFWMDCFTIESCKNRAYEGRIFGDIVREKEADPLEMLFDILIEDPEMTWYLSLDRRYAPAAIPEFIKHPHASPCTDTFVYSAEPTGAKVLGDPPLTTYGTFPQYIGYYVRETNTLRLEEAVRKATSLPSQIIGLKDRGIIQPGAFADIVVFDLGTIRMKGDNSNPAQPPEGIEYVLVNGKVVYKDMDHTGEKPGKILRRGQQKIGDEQ